MHQGPPTNFGNSQSGNPTFFSPFANNLNAPTNTNVGGPPVATFSNSPFPPQGKIIRIQIQIPKPNISLFHLLRNYLIKS
jgi:hypothetical protein